MQNKLLGLLFIICGVLMMIGAVVVEIAWLAFCFGTVVIGILMLIFSPTLLFAPFVFLMGIGTLLLGSGINMISED